MIEVTITEKGEEVFLKLLLGIFQQHYPEMLEKMAHGLVSRTKDNDKIEAPVDYETMATDFLHEIGMPVHIKGYRYTREAIVMASNDATVLDFVTKDLYPAIAKAHGTTGSRVERAIRHAIEVVCSRGDMEAVERIYGHTFSKVHGKPTNSEFIAKAADMFRRGAYRSEANR